MSKCEVAHASVEQLTHKTHTVTRMCNGVSCVSGHSIYESYFSFITYQCEVLVFEVGSPQLELAVLSQMAEVVLRLLEIKLIKFVT